MLVACTVGLGARAGEDRVGDADVDIVGGIGVKLIVAAGGEVSSMVMFSPSLATTASVDSSAEGCGAGEGDEPIVLLEAAAAPGLALVSGEGDVGDVRGRR